MRRKLCSLIVSILILFSSPQPACPFSITEEKEIGEQLLTLVRKEFVLLDDFDIQQYINELGREFVSRSGLQYFDYHFFVVSNKQFNAFAAPSGLIFVHSGLIETMTSEGELAGVIAHEIAHITDRHIADRIAKNKQVSAGTAALMLLGIALGGGPVTEALITSSVAAGIQMNLQFSRENEEEADRRAFRWMLQNDRDPAELESMLWKMRQLSSFTKGNLPPYLQTHPEPARRLSYVQDLRFIEQQKGSQHAYPARDPFPFARFNYRIVSLEREPQPQLNRLTKMAETADLTPFDRTMVHYGMHLSYLGLGEFDKAEAELAGVMAALPENSLLTADMGVVVFRKGDYGRAKNYFLRALELSENNDYARYQLAQTHEQLGEPGQAKTLYLALLERYNDHTRLNYNLGNVFSALDEKGKAFYYHGCYSWYQGDGPGARRNLGKALALLPDESREKDQARQMLEKISRIEKRQQQ